MCGIIGFSGTKVTSEQIEVLKKVMVNSRIRGMHASGAAWIDGNNIGSHVRPIPIDQLVEELSWDKIVNEELHFIAHARYSTSDIKYNQPLFSKNVALVHNGVITQVAPNKWKDKYGYDCVTKNDSELLLRAVESGDDVNEVFKDSSIAALVLDVNNKGIFYFRNGLRPMWKGNIEDSIVYASTYDILHRSGVTNITKVQPSNSNDTQRRDFSQWKNNLN